MAAGLFLLPSGALLGMLALIASANGLSRDGFALWAWSAIALGGLGYVHAQTLATALLVSLAHEAVTRDRAQPSETQNPTGSTSDEAPSP
jgi:hypothetical protein